MVFYGALASLALDFQLTILHTVSKEDTAKVLFALGSRAFKDNTMGLLLKKTKKSNPVNIQQLSILVSLPGIGDARALKLRKILDTIIIDEKIDLQTALDGYDVDKNIVW